MQNENQESKRWLKVKEVAKIFGVHPASIYDAAAKGLLPCARLPGIGLRIDRQALMKAYESDLKARKTRQRATPKPEPKPAQAPETEIQPAQPETK